MCYKGFFSTYGGGHVKSIIPIVKKLNKNGFHTDVLGLTNSISELSKSDIDHSTVSKWLHLYTTEEREKILELGNLALVASPEMQQDLDSVIYHGIGLLCLMSEVGTKEALVTFEAKGRSCFLPVDFAERVLLDAKPDFVFVTCGQRLEHAFALSANKLNIPVFRLVDLVGLSISVNYKATILVGNEHAKEFIFDDMKLGNKICVTGNPNFHYKSDPYSKKNSEIFYISYFSQPGVKGRNAILEIFSNLLKEKLPVKFFYKPHPSENLKDLINFNDDIFFTKDLDANKLISESDLVITHFSSVGYQAINQNKALVKVNFAKEDFAIDYSKIGCAKEVISVSELIRIISDLCLYGLDEFSSELANYKKFQQPQNPVNNILDAILSTLKE